MTPIQTVGNWTPLEWVLPIMLVGVIVFGWYMAISVIYSDPSK